MPRIHQLLCGGFFLLNAAIINAQILPKKPTMQQVIGYQMQQQKNWYIKQLPQNSVLYKFGHDNPTWRSYEDPVIKEKYPALLVQSNRVFTILNQGLQYKSFSNPLLSIQPDLLHDRLHYSKSLKQSWWKDPLKAPGSGVLRDIFIKNGNGLRM